MDLNQPHQQTGVYQLYLLLCFVQALYSTENIPIKYTPSSDMATYISAAPAFTHFV